MTFLDIITNNVAQHIANPDYWYRIGDVVTCMLTGAALLAFIMESQHQKKWDKAYKEGFERGFLEGWDDCDALHQFNSNAQVDVSDAVIPTHRQPLVIIDGVAVNNKSEMRN